MQFHAITLNSVPEASYLTAENAWRYRAIMRTFYLESQKAHIRLNKTELLALLRADGHFAEYTAEQLEQDLNALCSWRNLVPIQDPHRPTSIAEYKNKQFSYSMSQTATEIERMTISLENLDLRTAILSSQLFERILDTLERMTERTGADARNELVRTVEVFERLFDVSVQAQAFEVKHQSIGLLAAQHHVTVLELAVRFDRNTRAFIARPDAHLQPRGGKCLKRLRGNGADGAQNEFSTGGAHAQTSARIVRPRGVKALRVASRERFCTRSEISKSA